MRPQKQRPLRRMMSLAVSAVVGLSGLRTAQAEPAEEYRGKVFLGLDVETVKLPEDPRYRSTHGFVVRRVAVASSAERAGVQVGDVIASIDGEEWKGPEIRLSYSFGKQGMKNRPGDKVELQVLRTDPANPEGPKSLIDLTLVLVGYPGTQRENPGAPANAVLRPDLEGTQTSYEQLCWKLIREFGFEKECDDLLDRLYRCEEFPDTQRLAIVRYVHRDPFKLERVTHELTDPLSEILDKGIASCPSLIAHGARGICSFAPPSAGTQPSDDMTFSALPAYKPGDLPSHLAYIEAVLASAAELHRQAFSRISGEEVEFILKHRNGMLDSYTESRMLSYDTRPERLKASWQVINLASKVDLPALVRQARVVSLLIAPDFVASLRAAAGALPNPGAPVLAQRQTPYGNIIIGGTERTRYEGADHAAIYDLGGDDVYANNQASSVWGKIPSAVIVDYAGNDAYESHEPFRQGCGDFGVGLLVDLDGNDTYVGTRFTQGTAFHGVGLLCDARGDDVYRGIEFHQGVGHWGCGILVDLQGADRYEAHDTSQAVGLPGGCGWLIDAGPENDSYYCKGKVPTGYENSPGVFEGWGQGMGVGYRPYASGGLGVLFDSGGSDRFEAGNFCQGGGYFYAFGVLVNRGLQPDTYIASRYGQGFGCHQAAGAFIEEGGDDRYLTRQFVAQGLAWDEAVALFIDEAGDDRYEGGGFSQGASAMNGWILFIDRGGKDTYLYTDQSSTGGNSYHGGFSLSFFLDLGGGDDRYPRRQNNSISRGGERWIFADLPGTPEQALQADSWKTLVKDETRK